MLANAGERKKRARRSPCARFLTFFSFAFLFSPEVQAESLFCMKNGDCSPLKEEAFACDSQAVSMYLKDSYIQSLTCRVGSKRAPLHEVAHDCKPEAVARYLKEGHKPDVEAVCYFSDRTPLPKATADVLARVKKESAHTIAQMGIRELLHCCWKTLAVLDNHGN